MMRIMRNPDQRHDFSYPHHIRMISYAKCVAEVSVTERASEREIYYANSERFGGGEWDGKMSKVRKQLNASLTLGSQNARLSPLRTKACRSTR